MGGLRIAAGIMDPVDTNDSSPIGKAYQENPRFETEITYQFDLAGAQIYSWINGMQQNSENTDRRVEDVTSKGLGYGVQAKMGGLTLTASGFQAEGINPFFTNNLDRADPARSRQRRLPAAGLLPLRQNRVALSYGKTKDDGNGLGSAADYETRGIAYFRRHQRQPQAGRRAQPVRDRGARTTDALDEDTRTLRGGCGVLAF